MQDPEMNLSIHPLRWMVYQAGALGLRTMPFDHKLSDHKLINVTESLTLGWWPLEFYPWYRLTYTRRNDGKKTTRKQVFSNREALPRLTVLLGPISRQAAKYMLIRKYMVLSCWPVI